jgi:hypothetical protein
MLRGSIVDFSLFVHTHRVCFVHYHSEFQSKLRYFKNSSFFSKNPQFLSKTDKILLQSAFKNHKELSMKRRLVLFFCIIFPTNIPSHHPFIPKKSRQHRIQEEKSPRNSPTCVPTFIFKPIGKHEVRPRVENVN